MIIKLIGIIYGKHSKLYRRFIDAREVKQTT
nr:MAG TPA: hypothetical protein [Caudoviricetes sp.]